MAKPTFANHFTALQRELIDDLAAIEKSDADACAHCGGEDCMCCEIYHDRMKWKDPTALFDEGDSLFANEFTGCRDWDDEDDEDDELLEDEDYE